MPYRKLELFLYVIVFAVSVGFCVWSERLDFRLERQTEASRIAEINQSIASGLEAAISEIVARANGMAAVVALDPDIEQSEFSAAAARLGKDSTIVQNISLSTDMIVRRVYPIEQNSALLGEDYRTLPDQIQGVEKALKSAQPIFLGPVDLVQGGRGFILRLAFARNYGEGQQSKPREMISIVVDATSFFGDVDLAVKRGGIKTVITRIEDATVIYGDPSVLDGDPVTIQSLAPTNAWQVASAPIWGWPQISANASKIAAVGSVRLGIVLVVLRSIFGLLRKQRLAEERLLSAIDALDDGFALFDRNDRLTISNLRYHEIYETSADLLKPGATFEEIIRGGAARGQYPDAEGREEEWIRDRLTTHRLGNQVIEQRLNNGRWLKVAERRTSDGGIVGFRVDVTELKLATEAAVAADRAKSDFISVLSHELRTPLTIVMGYERLIASTGKLPAAVDLRESLREHAATASLEKFEALVATIEEMASKAHRSAQQLLGLINHLLDFSKIEAGKVRLDITDVDVAGVLADIGESFREAIEAKGLSFEMAINEACVRADPIRFKQVLTNLLSNSLKFTESGGIVVETEMNGDKMLFQVRDTGCGIPKEMAERVFGPFEQVDASATRRAGGTGLGLAISRNLVELMGGEMGFESSERTGSTFWFTLPLVASAVRFRSRM